MISRLTIIGALIVSLGGCGQQSDVKVLTLAQEGKSGYKLVAAMGLPV